MVLFKYVKWKNFLSTGNYFNEINLQSHAVSVIVGKNGAGKSTMLDAICFCLFNKGFRNVPKGNFVNSINNSEQETEVGFSIGKKEYIVRRGTKPSFFEIYVNGIILDQVSNVRDHQSYLEKTVLHLNWKSFTQVVMLGSAIHHPFMQLPTGSRREIIEDLLDLKIFSIMKSLLKDKFDVLKHDIENLNTEISSLESEIELEKTYKKKSTQDNTERIKKDKLEIKKTKEIISKELEAIKILKEDLDSRDEVSLKKSLSNIQKKTQELNRLEQQIDIKIQNLETDIHFFGENDKCPTCKQEMKESWKKDIIIEKKNKIIETRKGVELLTEKTTELDINKVDTLTKISEIDDIRKRINAHKNTIFSYEKFIEKLQSDIDDLISNKHSIKTKDIKIQENTLANKISDKDKLLELRDIYNIASVLLKDNGIKANVIKQYIPIINSSINKYLSYMDFFVKFNLDENFEETIKSRHLDNFKYYNFSEGEKQRINLSILFAWRDVSKKKNSMSTNLLILDEIFDSAMDIDGSDAFIKIIKSLTNQNVFIITHKQEIADKLESDKNRIIKFEKIKNFSQII